MACVTVVLPPTKFTDVLGEVERVANFVDQHGMFDVSGIANFVWWWCNRFVLVITCLRKWNKKSTNSKGSSWNDSANYRITCSPCFPWLPERPFPTLASRREFPAKLPFTRSLPSTWFLTFDWLDRETDRFADGTRSSFDLFAALIMCDFYTEYTEWSQQKHTMFCEIKIKNHRWIFWI